MTTGLTTVLLAMILFLTYTGATAPKPPTAEAALRARAEAGTVSPEVLKGISVYQQYGCAACHTISGSGGAAGPDLTEVGRRRDAEWLESFIPSPSSVFPGSPMPAYDYLTPEELEALIAYLRTLR